MEAGMYSMSIPVLSRMLGNLDAILVKAASEIETRKLEPGVLLATRLYPDMFPFVRQVQLASDFAKGAAARLAGLDVPVYEDNEQNFEQLRARIGKTLAFIGSVDPTVIDASATRQITIQARDRTFQFTGMDYLTRMVLPNFFFHVTIAYAILRQNGFALGKRDFTGA